MQSDSQLNIIVKAKNEASKVLRDINSDAGSAGKGLKSAFDNAVGPSKAVLAGVTLAGAAVVGFGIASINAWNEQEKAITQLNTVLKSTGGVAGVTAQAATDLSVGLQKVTTYADETILGGEDLLLTFNKIGSDIFPQATETMLNMSTALGQDVKSSAIQLGKALQDPVLGVTALRRVGVNFSKDQVDVIKKLVDTGRSAEAQRLILKELNTEFGGSARAATQTFSGQLQQIKNNFNDLMEGVGKFLADAMQPLVKHLEEFNKKVQESGGLIEYLKQIFDDNKGTIYAVAGAIAGSLVPALFSMAAGLASSLFWLAPFIALGAGLAFLWEKNRLLFWALAGAVAGFAIAVGVIMLPTIVTATAGFLAMAVAVIAATWPFVLIGGLIAGAAYLIITNWDTLKQWFSTFWQFLVGIWQDVWNIVTTVWNGIYAVVSAVLGAIWAVIKPFVDLWILEFKIFMAIATYAFDVIRAIAIIVFSWLWNNVIKPNIDFWVGAFNFVWSVVSSVFTNIKNFIGLVISWVWNNAIAPVLSAVRGGFDSVWSVVSSVFNRIKAVVGGVAGSISGAFTSGFESAKNIAKDSVNWMIDKINSVIHAVNNSAGKLPGVPHINDIPHLAKGVTNFAGGAALVGEHGPELVTLPQGSNVITNGNTNKIVDAINKTGGAGGMQVHIYGNVVNETPEAANAWWDRIDRTTELAGLGVPG